MRIPPSSLVAFNTLSTFSSAKIGELIEHLRGLQQPPLRVSEVQRAFTDVVGQTASKVAQDVLALYALKRDAGISAEKLVDELTDGLAQAAALKESPSWDGSSLSRWRELRPLLIQLFSQEPIDVASKAVDLAYEYANLLSSTRIVTDIRPVYDDSGDRIMAAVVSQTLRIRYTSADGDHSISLAMDEDDLEQLRESCEKALRKALAAQDLLKTAKISTLIGDDNDRG